MRIITNQGASFGMNFLGIEWLQVILLVICLWLWFKQKATWGWLLIFVGGWLNLYERMWLGGVRDYWQIPGTRLYNNLNDYLIAAGVIQVLWYFLWKARQK